MSFILAALLLAGQTGTPAQAPAPAAKAKPKQVCEYMEVTGSRAKKRVCRDENGDLDLGPGVSNSAFGKAGLGQSGAGSSAPGTPQ